MRRMLSLLLALACPQLSAETLSADEFAYGSEIVLEGEGALWELALTDAVYRRVTRGDAGDVRVFNADGVEVAHAMGRAQPETGDAPQPVELSVFPISSAEEEALVGRRMRVVTDETGAIVRTETEAIKTGDGERVGSYLLDLSAIDEAPNRLELEWRQREPESFTATLRIEASDDLTRWTPLVREFTIAELHAGLERVARNSVELPVSPWSYLRIVWPAALRDTELVQVTAHFPTASIELPRSWLEIDGVQTDDARVFEFDAQGRYPVDRAAVSFGDDNVVVRGRLSSRAAPDGEWRERHRGTYFSVRSGGEVVKSEPVTLTHASDRYWRLELDDDQQPLAAAKPVLSLGWTPQVLTFVAQGPPPYLLAYGNVDASRAPDRVAPVLAAMEDEQRASGVGDARLGAERELGGPARLVPAPEPFPWKTWTLWAVLIVGVALLAWMVVWLLRQLDASATRDS